MKGVSGKDFSYSPYRDQLRFSLKNLTLVETPILFLIKFDHYKIRTSYLILLQIKSHDQ